MIKFNFLILNLISAILIYFSLQLNWLSLFNIILFLLWVLSLNYFSQSILSRIFLLPKLLNKLLGIFLNVILLGLILNIFTSWFVFSNLSIFLSLILTSLFLIFWSQAFKKLEVKNPVYLDGNNGIWNVSNLFLLLFLFLSIVGFVIIAISATGNYLLSPWQVLPLNYLILVLILFIIIFSLVYSKKKTWLILTFIVIFSFLIHSYLLVYSQGFGGDRWRHLGSENRIISGLEYQPTLIGKDLWYKNIFGFSVPQALIAGPKISYGLEWSLISISSKISNVSIFTIDQYFIFILWSLFVPLIIFVAALQIKSKNSYALLASSLTLVFYILQYYGGQTLPISFGAIIFLFLITLFLAYSKNRQNKILYFIFSLVLLSYFSYSLSFIISLISLVWLLALNLAGIKKYLIFILLSLTIFFMEVLSSFSYFTPKFNFKEIISNILLKSNFLFFEKGQFLLAVNNYSIWLFLIFMLGLFLSLIYSFFYLVKEKNNTNMFLFGISFILIINYLSSWIFLDGLHTLARRMNVFMVLLLVLILAYGLNILIYSKFRAIIAVLMLSLLGTLTYASGPILEAAVTKDDTLAMEYIWQQVSDQPNNFCIIADSWPLLALESYSAKEIVAGNFPSDFNYQQPERVSLFNDFIKRPSQDVINQANNLAKTSGCFIVINSSLLDLEKINQIKILLGQPMIFGQNLVWQYKK